MRCASARQRDGAPVIGAETFSRILDWEDRGNLRPSSGRWGRAAVVLKKRVSASAASAAGFILSSHLHSDGRQYMTSSYVDGRPPRPTRSTGLYCGWKDGREVLPAGGFPASERGCRRSPTRQTNSVAADIDWLVPTSGEQQAASSMGGGAGKKKLGPLARKGFVMTIETPRQHLRRLDPARSRGGRGG